MANTPLQPYFLGVFLSETATKRLEQNNLEFRVLHPIDTAPFPAFQSLALGNTSSVAALTAIIQARNRKEAEQEFITWINLEYNETCTTKDVGWTSSYWTRKVRRWFYEGILEFDK